MEQKIKKAVVATVKIGHIEFEGLMLPNGDYAIAVSQLVSMNLVPPNRSLKQLQARSGMEFPSHQKVKSGLNSKTINIISLLDFERLLAKLDRNGQKTAQDLRDELIGLSFHQLFSDAFGQKFEKEDRQEWLKERQEGKFVRRTFTDAIKDYIKNNQQLSDNEKKWMYLHTSNTLNKLLFGKTAKQLCEYYECPKDQLRDQFERKDIVDIRRLEEYAMNLVDIQNIHPAEAIKEAFGFWDGARGLM